MDNRYNDIFNRAEKEEEKKEQLNSFFDILKLRMGEYRELKTEQRNQKAVDNFQNFANKNGENQNFMSNIHNTPFDQNVSIDNNKYQL